MEFRKREGLQIIPTQPTLCCCHFFFFLSLHYLFQPSCHWDLVSRKYRQQLNLLVLENFIAIFKDPLFFKILFPMFSFFMLFPYQSQSS